MNFGWSDRFQPLTAEEEREIERLQQEEGMEDEFGTIIMDEEDAEASAIEIATQNLKAQIRLMQDRITMQEAEIAKLQKHLNGREYAASN